MKAENGLADSRQAFEELNDSADPTLVDAWRMLGKAAADRRDEDENAMDVYDVQVEKGLAAVYQLKHSADRLISSG